MTSIKFIAAAFLAALLLSGCSDSDAPSGDDPADYMEASPGGYQAAPAVTVGEKAVLVWFKALVSGSSLPDGQAPSKIGWIEAAKKCRFPAPKGNERLVQVMTQASGLPTGIVALSKPQIQALSSPEALAKIHEDAAAARERAALKLVDVVVTDSSAPVYLVLAGGDDILWNIQKAAGATIAQVALIAGENGGIANLDPAVPVSALNGPEAKTCGAVPARKPKDNWTVVTEAAGGDIVAIDHVKRLTEDYGHYNTWFKETFGQESDPITIGIARMSHALVGPPVPSLDQRLPYRPLTDASVLLAPSQTIFYSASADDFPAAIEQVLAKNR
jgi:hypothetical protein